MSQIPIGNQPVPESQLLGTSDTGVGVVGRSHGDSGVAGYSDAHAGVLGSGQPGLSGQSSLGDGVVGIAGNGSGVSGISQTGTGVVGKSDTGRGVWGISAGFIASVGDSTTGTGVWGHSTSGVGVYGMSEQGVAGHFDGDIEVTGDIRLSNGDCAEEFDASEPAALEPGTVVVIDQSGAVAVSRRSYDKAVAGVVSGAGDLKPGIILDKQTPTGSRTPVALLGKVYCKVDAGFGGIEIGDLLTTSLSPGYAMKAGDPMLAFGSVIGKALRPMDAGKGLIPILIALQ